MQWVSWSGKDPQREYLLRIHEWFRELEAGLEEEMVRRIEEGGEDLASRGAVWTYLTTDRPSPNIGHRLARRIRDLAAVYLFPG